MKFIELLEARKEYYSWENAVRGEVNFNDYRKRKVWNTLAFDEESVEKDILGFVNVWGLCRIPYDRSAALFKALESVNDDIKFFKEKKLWQDFDFTDEVQRSHIKNIFIKLGNVNRVSSVAISKMLHLFCPDFFVMWDTAIMRSYGFCNNAEGYLNFLQRMKSEIVESSLLKHYRDNEVRKEATLLKLIDEFNMVKMRGK